jgi:ribonuclease BN (tRNA processing enzyme)
MRAKHLLLTHFSQRYPIAPLTSLSDPNNHTSVSLGVDLMEFTSSSLPYMAQLQSIQTDLANAWDGTKPEGTKSLSLFNVMYK